MNAPPDLTGALLAGRYRIVRLIGRGGMGAVYEGVQEELGRRVAIKVLHPHLSVTPDVVERFRREAQAAAALGHPNIVQVTDLQWRQGEPPFLVMELLSGASLGAVMHAQGPLPAARATFIASQILGALAAAHRAGIVHRDIKSDNVFLTSTAAVHDFVKVLDFGVAKLVGQGPDGALTSTGVAVGTPYYMSPEQARGRAVDARTDLFAVGVVLYHALSGRMPFTGSSFNELMFAIAEQTPAPLASLRPDLDPRLVAVVERALQKDVAARFQSADEMQAALAAWARPTTSAAPPPMTIADPTAPTMQAFAGSRAPSRIGSAGSAPPPARSPVAMIIGIVVAVFVLGGVALVVYVVAFRTRETVAGASSASSAPGTSSAPSAPTAAPIAVAPSATPDDAGSKTAIAKHDGGIVDAAAPAIADAAPPPPGPLKVSAYVGSINVVGATYDLDTVRAAVNPTVGAAAQCFAATRASDANVYFDYRITPAGQVSVSPRGVPAADQAAATCAAARLAATHFPPNPKKVADSMILSLHLSYP